MKLRKVMKLSAVLLCALVVSSCSTSQQYAGSKEDGAFFAIPNGWHQISNERLNKEEGKSGNQANLDRLAMVTYQVGYSPDKKVTPAQVFRLDPTEQPIIFARFRDLFPEERNSISLNSLRNVIVPVTDFQDGSIENTRNFQLLDDQEIIDKGGRGVNLTYSFDFDGVNETINQIALYSNDKNKIYLFIARCTTECFNKNQSTIQKIMNSFTVRGAR